MFFSGTSARLRSHSNQPKQFRLYSPGPSPAGWPADKPNDALSLASNAGLRILGPSLRAAGNPLHLALLGVGSVPSAFPIAAAVPWSVRSPGFAPADPCVKGGTRRP